MWFMEFIIDFLTDIRDWFLEAYYTVQDWVTPFNLLAYPLYYIYEAFYYLVFYFGQFNEWLEYAQWWLEHILDWNTIWNHILQIIPNLEAIRDWFMDWASNVIQMVLAWWESAQETVKGWIAAAVAVFQDIADAWTYFWDYLWPQFTQAFNSLSAAWSNFVTYTLPGLLDFSALTNWWNDRIQDVQGLIDSAFNIRNYLWEGWQDFKDMVAEFFLDPVEYIWSKFVDWFLGPEE